MSLVPPVASLEQRLKCIRAQPEQTSSAAWMMAFPAHNASQAAVSAVQAAAGQTVEALQDVSAQPRQARAESVVNQVQNAVFRAVCHRVQCVSFIHPYCDQIARAPPEAGLNACLQGRRGGLYDCRDVSLGRDKSRLPTWSFLSLTRSTRRSRFHLAMASHSKARPPSLCTACPHTSHTHVC